MTQEHLEIVGAVLGCIGALLLATNSRWSGWGFVVFLASNVAWILFSEQAGHHWFLVQQAVFTFTSLLGVWRWLIQPRITRWSRSKSRRIQLLGPITLQPLENPSAAQFESFATPVHDDQVDTGTGLFKSLIKP